MGFTDALSSAVRHHTGLHYVPSFNDFVSGAADDVEANELDRDLGRDQTIRPTVSAPVTKSMSKSMSNKSDDLPAMTSTVGDIHKLDRPLVGPGAGRADWVIDNARGGRRAPSVWQYILQSQGLEKLPTFEELAPQRHGTIGAEELQKHFKVSSSQAAKMVQEADRDNDSRISREEFEDIMASA